MRGYAIGLSAALLLTGCGDTASTVPSPTASQATGARPVNPAAIARLRSDLPPGYEVVELTGDAAPAGFWGVKPAWSAEPGPCGVLADPAPAAPVHGWSASGPGGIIHAVAAGPAAVASVPHGCRHWTLHGGRTTASVALVPAPDIIDTPTVAMRVESVTTVEGGTETRSHADTVTAHLPAGYAVSVTVVTDPGSALPVLAPDTAADLLVSAVEMVGG